MPIHSKRGLVVKKIALALIVFSLFLPIAFACVTPENGLQLKDSVILCQGEYFLDDGITVTGNDIILDCNNAILMGEFLRKGITVKDSKNVLIKNCIIKQYDIGLYAQNSEIRQENNNLNDNRVNYKEYNIEQEKSISPIKAQIIYPDNTPFKIDKSNYENAVKDINIKKDKAYNGKITSYAVAITSKKNIESIEYAEVLDGKIIFHKEYQNVAIGDTITENFNLEGKQEKDPESFVFNKKITHWHWYFSVLILFMTGLMVYSYSYQKAHKKYLYVKKKDKYLKAYLELEDIPYMAKRAGFVLFASLVTYLIVPVVHIFTAQFVGTLMLAVYCVYVLRLKYDIEKEMDRI